MKKKEMHNRSKTDSTSINAPEFRSKGNILRSSAHIFIVGAALGLGACTDLIGDKAPFPECSELTSNDDIPEWIGADARFGSDQKDTIILTVNYPWKNLVPKGEPTITGGTLVSQDEGDSDNIIITLTPENGVAVITVLVGSACDKAGYTTLIRLLLDDADDETLTIPLEILSPDAVDGDAGVTDSDV